MKSYHEGMKAKDSEKGQVTIPQKVREGLGIKPGDTLDFREESGRLVAVKEIPAGDWWNLRGSVRRPDGTPFASTEEYMAWVRPHRFGSAEERSPGLEEGSPREEGPAHP